MLTLGDYTNWLLVLANNQLVSRFLVDTFPYPYTRADAEWWISEGVKAERDVTKAIEYNSQFAGSVGIARQTGWRSPS